LLLSACHASATVAIRLQADGRGTVDVGVTLDREARAALSASGATTPDVPLDDLRARGWTVSSWRVAADGGATVRLSKPFTGGAELASVLADLDGRDGALRDAHVVRERALLRDRDAVSLVADLSRLRAGVADDAALTARLKAAGVDVAALDAGLNARLAGSFDLTVSVELPDGRHTTLRVAPGKEQTVALASSTAHPGRLAALVAAGIAGLLGLALLAIAAIRARRARARRPA
jgi:hypothetical protein